MSLVGIAEAAVFVVGRNPSWRVSQTALNYLMIDGDPRKIAVNSAFLVGSLLIVSGSLLRWSCYTYLGRLFTYEIAVQEEHHLVTSGPYAVVRHPAYSGILMIFAGFLIWQGSSGSWVRESGILKFWAGKVAAAASVVWFGVLSSCFSVTMKAI